MHTDNNREFSVEGYMNPNLISLTREIWSNPCSWHMNPCLCQTHIIQQETSPTLCMERWQIDERSLITVYWFSCCLFVLLARIGALKCNQRWMTGWSHLPTGASHQSNVDYMTDRAGSKVQIIWKSSSGQSERAVTNSDTAADYWLATVTDWRVHYYFRRTRTGTQESFFSHGGHGSIDLANVIQCLGEQ